MELQIVDCLESGEVARLIPVIADSRREQRAASVFLATLSAVPEFAQQLLSTAGIRLGKRAVVDTFTEVVFKSDKQAKDRPDGLIVVSSGARTWKALVEAKIGSSTLDDTQVVKYYQLARDNGIDAVITLSNQFVARPTHSPARVPKNLAKRVQGIHWSWKTIATEAILIQNKESIEDPDRAFIVREFVRFISHDSVGISGFSRMPPQWKDCVILVKSGGDLGKNSAEAEALVSAWHQETRDLSLRMSQHLATDVSVKLQRAHAADSDQRLKDDCAKLASEKRLEVEYLIPNAASTLSLGLDLVSQTIRVGMEIAAPLDRQRAPSRVNWLLRQMKSADDDRLFVRIVWPSRAKDTVCRLAELRDDPKQYASNATPPPKSFEVFLLSDDARRFSGRKTLIEEIETVVPYFYDKVGQRLQKWVPRPPKPVTKEKLHSETVMEESSKERSSSAKSSPKHTDSVSGNQHTKLLELPSFLRKADG